MLFYLLVIFYLLRKDRLKLRFSLLWLGSGLVMLVFALFPNLLISLAELSGFEVASNGLFAVCLFLLIMLQVYMTTIISDFSAKIKTLTQKLAIADQKINDLENKLVSTDDKK